MLEIRTAPKGLKPIEAEIFEFLVNYALRHGYGASLGEIAAHVGSSRWSHSLRDHLRALVAKGLVAAPVGGGSRTYGIVGGLLAGELPERGGWVRPYTKPGPKMNAVGIPNYVPTQDEIEAGKATIAILNFWEKDQKLDAGNRRMTVQERLDRMERIRRAEAKNPTP